MAISPTPPTIDLMPAPPLPTDAEAVFDEKAGASLTAQQAMIPQLNNALAWQAGAMAATADYKTAAEQLAAAAAQSKDAVVQAAADATTNGKAQVDLTVSARNAAKVSADIAQASAAAAGSAAGLPGLVEKDAFDVLQINAEKTGVQWGKAGQSVGDILVTARAPGSTYALTGRVPYLQTAYPDLYALLGAMPDTDRSVISNTLLNSSFPSDVTAPHLVANSGTMLVALNSGLVAFYHTSTDNGVTWVRRVCPFSNPSGIAYLNGVYVVCVVGPTQAFYTSTDGLVWVRGSFDVVMTYTRLLTVGGLFILIQFADRSYYTSPDGVKWTQRASAYTLTNYSFSNVNGYLVGVADGVRVVTSDGINFQGVTAGWAGGQLSLASVRYLAGTYYAVGTGADSALYTNSSLVSGLWSKFPNVFINSDGTIPAFSSDYGAVSIENECIFFNANLSRIWLSNDMGITWSSRATPINFQSAVSLPGKFIFFSGTQVYTLPYRSYDPATSFITTKAPVQPVPLLTYIKGKLA